MPMNPRLLRPTAAFNPTKIAGLSAWYDASRTETLFDAASGGSNVAADGTVARWEDLSGQGNHLTQSGASGLRPLRKDGEINGRSVVRFDGSDDRMVFTSALAASSLPGFTVLCVAKRWSAGTDNFVLMGQATAFVPYAIFIGPGSSYTTLYSPLTNQGVFRGNNAINVFNRTTAFLATADTSKPDNTQGSLPELYADRQLVTINDSGTTLAGASATTFTELGARRGGSALYAKADIAEVLYYSRVLAAGERAAAESYLQKKWGTP